MSPIKIGLLGFGTVGSGTLTVLLRNQEEIFRRAGRGIVVAMIAVRDTARAQKKMEQITRDHRCPVVSDPFLVVRNPDIEIVVELIGGTTIARELVLAAIAQGKHVVTANKALIALHGDEIFAAAQAAGVMVTFEAAVAGGVPIIKALREGLSANRIDAIVGIINGSTNFILSQMRERGLDFATVVQQAQELGYLEADPSFDIKGIDAAHKITIVSAIAFGVPMQFSKVHIEGIDQVHALDVRYAAQFGYRIKLLGITRRVRVLDLPDGGGRDGIELRVHPSLVAETQLLANVEGAMNAVLVHSDAVGMTMYYGSGAGGEPTASAVIADLIDVTRLHTAEAIHRVPHLAFQPNALKALDVIPMEDICTSYYLRLHVADEPGVLAEITRLLALRGISIEAMTQHKAEENKSDTDVVILTHKTIEKNMLAVLADIELLPTVLAPVVKIRMEDLS